MIELVTHNLFGFVRKEIWFYNGEPYSPSAYTVFCAAREVPFGECRFIEKYTTSVIDLGKAEKDLLAAIHPTFRYDIRSAERQGVTVQQLDRPTAADCESMLQEYDRFARSRKLTPLNGRFLRAACLAGRLCITKASSNKQTVTTHVYLFDATQASLLASFHDPDFSNDKLRSESNKLLHWKDILFFKSRGLVHYDLGGLNPEKLPGVSKFKESFGGALVNNYRLIQTPGYLFYLISVIKKLKGS
jgi:lipid II:glycine glycyltransferase (peptidoglycan interpeptide bridge formation enzyme)